MPVVLPDERGELPHPLQVDVAQLAVPVFGDQQLGRVAVFGVLVVIVLAVDEQHNVGVLLDGAGLAQVGKHRPLVGPVLRTTGKLAAAQHRHVELLGHAGIIDQQLLLLFDLRIGVRHRGQQRLRVRMQRVPEQLLRLRQLDDAALVDDRDTVGNEAHDAQVMLLHVGELDQLFLGEVVVCRHQLQEQEDDGHHNQDRCNGLQQPSYGVFQHLTCCRRPRRQRSPRWCSRQRRFPS